jgi:hypothetical protein
MKNSNILLNNLYIKNNFDIILKKKNENLLEIDNLEHYKELLRQREVEEISISLLDYYMNTNNLDGLAKVIIELNSIDIDLFMNKCYPPAIPKADQRRLLDRIIAKNSFLSENEELLISFLGDIEFSVQFAGKYYVNGIIFLTNDRLICNGKAYLKSLQNTIDTTKSAKHQEAANFALERYYEVTNQVMHGILNNIKIQDHISFGTELPINNPIEIIKKKKFLTFFFNTVDPESPEKGEKRATVTITPHRERGEDSKNFSQRRLLVLTTLEEILEKKKSIRH